VRVAVCVKQVPNDTPGPPAEGSTWSYGGTDLILDDTDRYGIELGLQLTAGGGEVALVSVGQQGVEQGIRQGLAMGVREAVLVADDTPSGADALTTARALAASITSTGFDLVITGAASTDGATGVLGAMLGEVLGVPSVSDVTLVEVQGEVLRARRQTPTGSEVVECALPAVISVTAGAVEPRYPNFKGVMDSKRRSIGSSSISSLLGEQASGGQKVVALKDVPTRSAGRTVEDDGEAYREILQLLDAAGVI
jgi:electron transfer flavoprotein beta subunit